MMNGTTAAATPEQLREMTVELQHSARQTERTLGSVFDAAGALLRDGGLAILGLGDVTVRLIRDLPRLVGGLRRLPEDLGDGIEQLCERGEEVVAQLRHDTEVNAAVRRTATARRQTRRAARSLSRAARSQAAGIRRSAATLGRRDLKRYRHMTVEDLRTLAARHGIDGRSQMSKAQLIAALRR